MPPRSWLSAAIVGGVERPSEAGGVLLVLDEDQARSRVLVPRKVASLFRGCPSSGKPPPDACPGGSGTPALRCRSGTPPWETSSVAWQRLSAGAAGPPPWSGPVALAAGPPRPGPAARRPRSLAPRTR